MEKNKYLQLKFSFIKNDDINHVITEIKKQDEAKIKQEAKKMIHHIYLTRKARYIEKQKKIWERKQQKKKEKDKKHQIIKFDQDLISLAVDVEKIHQIAPYSEIWFQQFQEHIDKYAISNSNLDSLYELHQVELQQQETASTITLIFIEKNRPLDESIYLFNIAKTSILILIYLNNIKQTITNKTKNPEKYKLLENSFLSGFKKNVIVQKARKSYSYETLDTTARHPEKVNLLMTNIMPALYNQMSYKNNMDDLYYEIQNNMTAEKLGIKEYESKDAGLLNMSVENQNVTEKIMDNQAKNTNLN